MFPNLKMYAGMRGDIFPIAHVVFIIYFIPEAFTQGYAAQITFYVTSFTLSLAATSIITR